MSIIDQLIRLIDVIVWPLTLLIILSWFRYELQDFFSNLKKIQAGPDGVVLESFAEQLSKTRDLFPASTVAKSNASIDESDDKFTVNPNLSSSVQLRNWHKELSALITKGTSPKVSKPEKALEQLRVNGKIKLDEYQKRKNLLKLTGMPASNLSESEVVEIQNFLNNLDI